MNKNMKKILIFKSDKIGDFIYFSPCLKILKENYNNCHITLVCSKYNYNIVKNYSLIDKVIIFKSKYFLINLINNFATLIINKYDHIFQYDGKNSSYWLAFFGRSKIKSTVCFIKKKKILHYEFNVYRPRKIILSFFKNVEFCYEDYSIKSHYQTLYIKLMENLNLKIYSKKNLFYLDILYKKIFDDLHNNIIKKNYVLIHFDEKWDSFNSNDRENMLKIVNKISSKNKVVVTLGIKKFNFIDTLRKKYSYYIFKEDKFVTVNEINNNVVLLNYVPVNLLAYLVKNSIKNISSHSGVITHMSPAFDKEFIDIIKKSKNQEYDRWIPLISKYKRINFEEINEKYLENFEI